uniref:Uncharacterized protein n=1 Tax=Oryza punctata TaxID=4537 RepID=A0A0E0ML10_ORYPU
MRKCTHAQKVNILRACWRWVKLDHGHRVLPPHNDVFDPCCNAARDVRALDMDCIVDLLTGEERRRYDVGRIRSLERIFATIEMKD